ncbi:cytochrome P450 [Stipitochalara longipes BDJ]|nr:cytochrome P450 [Stipitochalara longipes BDJ]
MAEISLWIFRNKEEAALHGFVLFVMLFLGWNRSTKALSGVVLILSFLNFRVMLQFCLKSHHYILSTLFLFAIQHVHIRFVSHRILHPLACYPGPFFWSVSRLPQTYYLFRVIRVAPNELSYTTLEAWDDIYTKGEDKKQLRKDLGILPSAATKVNGILFELDDEEHARLRRNISHIFSTSNIRAQEPIILKYTNQLIELIKSRDGEPVDVTEMFNFLLFDITGDMVFGDSFNCLTSATLHPWIKFIFARVSGAALLGGATKFWPFHFLFTPFIPKHLRDGDFKHVVLAKERLDKRLEKKGTRTDLYLPFPFRPPLSPLLLLTSNCSITHLQKTLKKPTGLSYDELVETTRTLIVGGAETTSTLLTGLIYHLLSPHPTLADPSYRFSTRPLETLTLTLRQAFKSTSEITSSAIQTEKLLYLKACVNEGLRLFPPLPGNLRRIVPEEGKMIAGNWVPGGMLVAVDILSANLSRENFTLPDGFCPERWFREHREQGKLFEGDRWEVVKPFSHGPRNCIGKNLALMEMQLILAHLLWHFDIELEEESKDWISRVRAVGFFVKPKLMVRFSPAGSRKDYAKMG